jgi:hypothetical protein
MNKSLEKTELIILQASDFICSIFCINSVKHIVMVRDYLIVEKGSISEPFSV